MSQKFEFHHFYCIVPDINQSMYSVYVYFEFVQYLKSCKYRNNEKNFKYFNNTFSKMYCIPEFAGVF